MSTSWSRLASSSSPPKVAAKRCSGAYQASSSMVARIVAARSRQSAARSARPSRSAMLASRSQAAQLITARIGVDAGAGAEFPQAGVGLVVHLPGALADLLERGEILGARRPQQALVEKGLGVGEDDLAVGVVLDWV